MRKEALKAYVFALLSEGEFSNTSPAEVASKAIAIFATDLPTVLGELAQMAAEQSGNRIGAAVLGKVNEVIGDVSRRGFKSVWADLQEQYKRGMDAKSDYAKSRK